MLRVLDVHEFHANRAAIALAQNVVDFAQGGGFTPQNAIDENGTVPVGGGEAVILGVQLRMRFRHLQAERIQAGLQMAAHAVDADHHQGADGIQRRGAYALHGGGGAALGRLGRGGGRRRDQRFALIKHGEAGRPGGAGGVREHGSRLVVQVGE